MAPSLASSAPASGATAPSPSPSPSTSSSAAATTALQRLQAITKIIESKLSVDARIQLEKCDRSVFARLPAGDIDVTEATPHVLACCDADVRRIAEALSTVKVTSTEVFESERLVGRACAVGRPVHCVISSPVQPSRSAPTIAMPLGWI